MRSCLHVCILCVRGCCVYELCVCVVGCVRVRQDCARLHPWSSSHHVAHQVCRWRPYRVECTGSLPNSEVKRRRARLVLGWGTAREDLRVPPAFSPFTLACASHRILPFHCFKALRMPCSTSLLLHPSFLRLHAFPHTSPSANPSAAYSINCTLLGFELTHMTKKACEAASAKMGYLEPKWLR